MCTLRRCCSRQPFVYTEFLGGSLYTISIADLVVDLFVPSLTEQVAMVRLRLVGVDAEPGVPSRLEGLSRPVVDLTLQALLHRLHAEIKAHLHASLLYDELSPPRRPPMSLTRCCAGASCITPP
jgi:hypothetical protein